MGDVADILGLKQSSQSNDESLKLLVDNKPKPAQKNKKPKGMSREVFGLIGHDSLNPSIQTNKVSNNFKTKRLSSVRRKWVWSSFSSNLADNTKEDFLKHWVLHFVLTFLSKVPACSLLFLTLMR